MISQSWSKPFISYFAQRRVNHVYRIITRHGSLESSIEAIRLGVQDYIQKPFDMEFLLASVKKCFTAKVERQHQERLVEQLKSSLKQLKDLLGVTTPALPDRQIVSLRQGIMVDTEHREIWRGKTRSHLSPTESKAMGVFLENQGRVLTHKELVFLIKGEEVTAKEAPKTTRPIICRLRKKLAVLPGMEGWVQNVRGKGYVFKAKV